LAGHNRDAILPALTVRKPDAIAVKIFTLGTLDKGVSPTDAHFGDFLETIRQHRIDQRVYHVSPFASGPDHIIAMNPPGS
jgi:hypothetical protein